jgi:hypothetical protein
VWESDATKWSNVFNEMNSDLLGSLAAGFADHFIISILHSVWESDTTKWSNVFNEMNSDLVLLLLALQIMRRVSLEAVRDCLRR